MIAGQESNPFFPMGSEAAVQHQAESAEPKPSHEVVMSSYLNDANNPDQPTDSLIFGPDSDEEYCLRPGETNE